MSPHKPASITSSNLSPVVSHDISISDSELKEIGHRIYKNECSNRIEKLTFWNPKEPFPSMGIAHFIWFPVGYTRPLGDSFSKVLVYFESNGIRLPEWLRKNNYQCPWKNRTAFYKDFNGSQMKYLRNLLKETMSLQAKFIINKFQEQAERVLNAPSDTKTRQHVREQFDRVAHSPMGMYALIDYVNFKGTGTMNSGDWGLLQVLENMWGRGVGRQALIDFSNSAKEVLRKRAHTSKTKKIDAKSLAGWYKRVDTYCQ